MMEVSRLMSNSFSFSVPVLHSLDRGSLWRALNTLRRGGLWVGDLAAISTPTALEGPFPNRVVFDELLPCAEVSEELLICVEVSTTTIFLSAPFSTADLRFIPSLLGVLLNVIFLPFLFFTDCSLSFIPWVLMLWALNISVTKVSPSAPQTSAVSVSLTCSVCSCKQRSLVAQLLWESFNRLGSWVAFLVTDFALGVLGIVPAGDVEIRPKACFRERFLVRGAAFLSTRPLSDRRWRSLAFDWDWKSRKCELKCWTRRMEMTCDLIQFSVLLVLLVLFVFFLSIL